MFEAHLAVWACNLALPKAGNSSEARIAMMAITTSNSINVKPAEQSRPAVAFGEFDGGSFMSFWCDSGQTDSASCAPTSQATPNARMPPGAALSCQCQ